MAPENTKREDTCPGKKKTLDVRVLDAKALDLAAVRKKIASTSGPEYWRSLEELAGSDEFREMMHREFPKGASEWLDSFSRRGFLQTMGASLALAGMTACTRQPLEQNRSLRPAAGGHDPRAAAVLRLGDHARRYASPVLVESHMGRPTKIEGKSRPPGEPRSLGYFRPGQPAQHV